MLGRASGSLTLHLDCMFSAVGGVPFPLLVLSLFLFGRAWHPVGCHGKTCHDVDSKDTPQGEL